MKIMAWGLAGLSGLLVAGPAWAAVFDVMPGDDVEAVINAAQPGDEIVLADGEYMLTERFSFDIAGTEAQPIVIRAADGAQPHLRRPDASQNIIDIDGATWVEIRGIEFSGGSAGIRISAADHLTIEDCEIHDTGDVALRANDTGALYESLRIIHNEIHHTNETGEGMYLGCNGNACQVANSVIERNYVHHTNQASIVQGDGIELKEGSYGNVIRDNVIHDTNYPCILTYSTVGNGPANVIERNVLWNCGDHAIQSAADATIRNNIILSAAQDGIAMQQHQSGNPQNLLVVHNTILKSVNDAISLRDTVGAVTIANNAVYASGGSAIFIGGGDTSMLTLAGNVGQGGVSGGGGGYVDGNLMADFVDGHFGGAPPIDVFPAPGGALVGAGDPAYVPDDDFNALARDGEADVGAYRYDPAGNPGWALAAEFKEFPDDGGGATSGGETGDDTAGNDSLDGTSGSPGDETNGSASDGSSAGESGTAATAASAGADGGDGGGGGCGCRARPDPRAPRLGGLALLVLLGALRRRRR
ncbi:MAG: right-handed parallel beta-helix repeat-containing protein [Myxococcales bacterium]|nr:right-handed parallel beta-helix repeat-containing protein [Myxococcales bacterium]